MVWASASPLSVQAASPPAPRRLRRRSWRRGASGADAVARGRAGSRAPAGARAPSCGAGRPTASAAGALPTASRPVERECAAGSPFW
eukprot:scaffold14103_cov29-Tisochrysis_lutea.AAC.1